LSVFISISHALKIFKVNAEFLVVREFSKQQYKKKSMAKSFQTFKALIELEGRFVLDYCSTLIFLHLVERFVV